MSSIARVFEDRKACLSCIYDGLDEDEDCKIIKIVSSKECEYCEKIEDSNNFNEFHIYVFVIGVCIGLILGILGFLVN